MLLGGLSAAIYSVFGRPVFGKHGVMFVMVLAVGLRPVDADIARRHQRRPDGLADVSRNGWMAVIFLGTLGAAIQFSLFTWALRWLPPSRVVIYPTLNPIVAILLASLFLGETVTPVLIAGLVFVIGGIFVAEPARGRCRGRRSANAKA